MSHAEDALSVHKRLRGKITTALKDVVDSPEKLSTYYTPGVGDVSRHLAEHPEETRDYTNTHNNVAIVSDGSAVLGLGNVGPEAALPVMEGKSMLFKSFADVDGIPIVLSTQDVDQIVTTVTAIAPSFGGINLEDIKAPECFEIEAQLKEALDIPVFHDDQHGTAVVVLAGLINACSLTGRELNSSRVAIAGVGAAGVAIIKLLKVYAPEAAIVAVDSQDIVSGTRDDLNPTKQMLVDDGLVIADIDGDIAAALKGSDVFIGVAKPELVDRDMVRSMNDDPIVFAMSNPVPEIMPDDAREAGAAVVATGRSDFPNQINNALVFPGIFRGALDNQVIDITDAHKIATAEVVAGLVDKVSADMIIPSIFDERLVPAIAARITPPKE